MDSVIELMLVSAAKRGSRRVPIFTRINMRVKVVLISAPQLSLASQKQSRFGAPMLALRRLEASTPSTARCFRLSQRSKLQRFPLNNLARGSEADDHAAWVANTVSNRPRRGTTLGPMVVEHIPNARIYAYARSDNPVA